MWRISLMTDGSEDETKMHFQSQEDETKYEQKVNSRKVSLGLRPKFFANFSCQIMVGSNSGKKKD